MSSSITTWKILLLWMLPCYRAEGDGMYECGAHGRFEYCIDGIPGCVIGCHCHPGYYFDTESKICEPNSKLTQNYRRQYIPEPTRIQNPSFLSNYAQTEPLPILTTHNIIDEQVNDITKNADDLGDWLYNQFFKTIENQVINKTSKDNQLTRRSGRDSIPKHNKLKRRARKKGNRHKKKKKGLQGKLLRIAEDDSLFESSDSSDSDHSSPEFIHSDSTFESDSDEDHGHKKILLINKKPRAPLPSFIFLPNMNTPYYPPIGLPPPPVMPMYPMVPVPPMLPAPPPMQFPGTCVPECDENTTAKTEIPTAHTGSTAAGTSTAKVDAETTTVTSTTAQTDTPSSDVPALRSRYKGKKRKKVKSHENIADDYGELPSDIYEPSRESRQKLIKLLRQRMNYPRIDGPPFKKHRNPFDKHMNQLVPPDTLMDNDITDYVLPKDKNTSPTNVESPPELENVDFKYLSQLIHRVNENQTQNVQNSPQTAISTNWSNKRYHDVNTPLDSGRRRNQENIVNTSRNHRTDDTYYSNLGRQIATLIRTVDADKERQFNIEIEKVQQKTNDQPFFNENGPRTFWERSVRSPLTFFHSFKNRFDSVKNSNEVLFNIENKVETVASTVPTLSLHELENLINVMQTARTRLQSNTSNKNVKPLNKTLNINLWPKEVNQSKKSNKSPIHPDIFNAKRRAIDYSNMNNKLSEIKSSNIRAHNPYPFTNRVTPHRVNDAYINRGIQMQTTSRNMTKMYIQPLNLQKGRKFLHSSEKHRLTMKPAILNYKNIKKYFFDNNNQYSFQNDNLGLHYSPASRAIQHVNPLLISSPYFHHEINHIDYMS